MKIIEKDFFIGEAQLGATKHYVDVDPLLLPTLRGERVLPAPFFNDQRLKFTLIKRYEVGERKSFPRGGYEVRDENGGSVRSYELDQLIIHPSATKIKVFLEGDVPEETEKTPTTTTTQTIGSGKRGRPALSPEDKAARAAAAEAKPKGTGKRGRPKASEAQIAARVKPEGPMGGKRGRRPLSPEELVKREQLKAAKALKSGGKRGRPKKS